MNLSQQIPVYSSNEHVEIYLYKVIQNHQQNRFGDIIQQEYSTFSDCDEESNYSETFTNVKRCNESFDEDVTIEYITDENKIVFCRLITLTKKKKEWMNLPVLNQIVENYSIAIYKIKNGKIINIEIIEDHLDLLLKMGYDKQIPFSFLKWITFDNLGEEKIGIKNKRENVCAWCDHDKLQYRNDRTLKSHGICKSCVDKYFNFI